jgi:hypothetical protein
MKKVVTAVAGMVLVAAPSGFARRDPGNPEFDIRIGSASDLYHKAITVSNSKFKDSKSKIIKYACSFIDLF